jgi:hypothetical protein
LLRPDPRFITSRGVALNGLHEGGDVVAIARIEKRVKMVRHDHVGQEKCTVTTEELKRVHNEPGARRLA